MKIRWKTKRTIKITIFPERWASNKNNNRRTSYNMIYNVSPATWRKSHLNPYLFILIWSLYVFVKPPYIFSATVVGIRIRRTFGRMRGNAVVRFALIGLFWIPVWIFKREETRAVRLVKEMLRVGGKRGTPKLLDPIDSDTKRTGVSVREIELSGCWGLGRHNNRV